MAETATAMPTISMERPKRSDPAVRGDALDKLLPDVFKWFGTDVRTDEDRQGIRKDLEKVVSGWNNDGYHLVKRIDDMYHWGGDRELVEIMDCWSGYEYEAHRKWIKWWVRAADIKPAHKIGDTVRAKHGMEEIAGEIVAIDQEHAEYTVRRAGDGDGCGAIVPYELVIVPEVANAAAP